MRAQPPDQAEDDISPERSEVERARAAQKATKYDPRHVRLQNKLYRSLCARYGRSAVLYEEGFVDLTLVQDGHVTFIEVKTEPTVKSGIRSAFGQLLEYAHYPNLSKADTLLAVGDAIPTADDIAYLQHIRNTYGLPIYYTQWSWAQDELRQRV